MADIYIAKDDVCYQLHGPQLLVAKQYLKDKQYGAKEGSCHSEGYNYQTKQTKKWHGFEITRWTKNITVEGEGRDVKLLWSDDTGHYVIAGKKCV